MKKIFIGSSSESVEKARNIKNILEKLGAKTTLWTDITTFKTSENIFDALLRNARIHNGAVFVFDKDDKVVSESDRPDKYVPRDNVLIETGIFSGVLGKQAVAICKVDGVGEISDLSGHTHVPYDHNVMEEKFKSWLNNIDDEDKEKLNQFPLNIHMGKKNVVEARSSIYERLCGVKNLTLVNFAATAFITGAFVDENYEGKGGEVKRWLQENLSESLDNNSVRVSILLTDPGSFADSDASEYKMYPRNITREIYKYFILSTERNSITGQDRKLHHFIIQKNFNLICDIMLRLKLKNLEIFCTDVALPVGIMKSEYRDEMSMKDELQVNIYLPCIGNDENRPTFVMKKRDHRTREIYNIFEDVIRNLKNSATRFYGHPDVEFLFERPIIHRAMLESTFCEMSRDAVKACAENGCPVEVDLLWLPIAHEILVCRDKEVVVDGENVQIVNLSRRQLEKLRRAETRKEEDKSQLMTLGELLSLVKEVAEVRKEVPIPLLLELKEAWNDDLLSTFNSTTRDNVIRVCRIMKNYELETGGRGKYALHSSNPFVIRCVKDYDVRIPCGWISLDFGAHKDRYPVTEKYKNIHLDAMCFGGPAYEEEISREKMSIYYPIPDFVSCKIGDFSSPRSPLREKCKEYNIKRLGWVAFTQEEYDFARRIEEYDNVLIENFY